MATSDQGIKKKPAMPSTVQVLGIALPLAGLMLCHLGISLTDMWVAGRIDSNVLASLGVVSQIFALLMLITSIAGSGCLAAVSQALGAGLEKRACRYAGLILRLALCVGAVVGGCGYLCAPYILDLLSVPEPLVPVVKVFISVYCLNLPFYYCLIMLNSIFRAYKLVLMPLLSFGIVLAVNFFGSTGLGLGWWGLPQIGYAGIPWATFGATLLGLCVSISSAMRHRILRRGSFAGLRWSRKAMPYILKVGGPAALGQLAEQTGSIFLLSLVSRLPHDAVAVMAGMTLGMRVASVLLFPLGAVSLTMAIFSGHLLGAGQHAILYSFGRRFSIKAAGVFLLGSALLFFMRHELAHLMTTDADAASRAVLFLEFSCLGIPLLAVHAVLNGVFSGTGATRYSCIAGAAVMWVIQVPLAYILAYTCGLAERGIFLAMLAARILQTVCMLAIYRSEKWLECGQKKRQHGGNVKESSQMLIKAR